MQLLTFQNIGEGKSQYTLEYFCAVYSVENHAIIINLHSARRSARWDAIFEKKAASQFIDLQGHPKRGLMTFDGFTSCSKLCFNFLSLTKEIHYSGSNCKKNESWLEKFPDIHALECDGINSKYWTWQCKFETCNCSRLHTCAYYLTNRKGWVYE